MRGRLLLGVVLLVPGCAAQPPPSVVQGRSSAEPGVSCAPAPPVDDRLPAGFPVPPPAAVLTAVARGSVTGRVPAALDDVVAHFRSALDRAGWVVQREEDEGRAVLLGFFGARGEGTLTVAELTCPAGSTGFTVTVAQPPG